MSEAVAAQVSASGPPDVLLVSGLVDVSQLLGLSRHWLPAQLPVAVYQHESQLAYAPAEQDRSAVLANWASWLAADAVFFNSDFHRGSVIEALPGFLAGLPDNTHRGALATVVGRFEVLPVGVDLSWVGDRSLRLPDGDGPVIVWSHRWENDKDPVAFGRALDRLVSAGLQFRLVLAGDEGPAGGGYRDELAARHRERMVAVGPFDRGDYRRQLQRADIVVSCARHEFFGVALVEAVAAGCHPVVPDALAYPEVLGSGAHLYPPGRFGSALEEVVRGWSAVRPPDPRLAARVARYDWSCLAGRYDERLAALVVAGG